MDELRSDRKVEQERVLKELASEKDEIRKLLEDNESPDIKEDKLYERRNWVTQFYEDHEGKELPKDVDDFYERHNVAKPLSPEEEDAA